MQVPRACSWCELLSSGPRGSWGCRMSSQQWGRCSSAWSEGLKGCNTRWGRWQNGFSSSAGEKLSPTAALSSLSASVPGAARVPCSINTLTNTQIHTFGYIYIHTYTRTHSFQLRVTRAFLCVCKLTTLVCRHGKKGCLFSMDMDPFLFCEHVRSKKKFLLTVWRWSSC